MLIGAYYDTAINYALCTSDANYAKYRNTHGPVVDENQIATGLLTFQVNSGNSGNSVTIEFTVSVDDLRGGTELYLFMWANYNGLNDFIEVRTQTSAPTITINYIGPIVIDNETELETYSCHIDTEYLLHESASSKLCSFDGHGYIDGNGSTANPQTLPSKVSYSTTENAYMGYNAGSPRYPVYFLKFTTPAFMGESDHIFFYLTTTTVLQYRAPIYYWLTSSDENFLLYAQAAENSSYEVSDANIVESGVWSRMAGVQTIEFNVSTSALRGNKTYYLILWTPQNTSYASTSIIRTYALEQTVYYKEAIIHSSEFVKYHPYIDTGTGWKKCT